MTYIQRLASERGYYAAILHLECLLSCEVITLAEFKASKASIQHRA